MPTGHNTKVLVVDDERVTADSLALILRGRGFDSRAVYSGEEAAVLAPEWKPDAVITDVVMGKMDGVALSNYLAHTLPDCRVLLISGHNDAEALIDEGKSQGRELPFLAKPFHPDSLLEFLGPASPAEVA